MTIVAIHQPNFLPYPGFFYKMRLADVLVLYDTAQFVRREYHNRNRIKAPNGARWLTVPVKTTGFVQIREVVVDDAQDWRTRIWKTIQVCYGRAPHYARYAPMIQEALTDIGGQRLADMNVRLIRLLQHALGLRTELRLASELSPRPVENPTGKLIEITRAAGGDNYLSGAGALDYLEPKKFKDVILRIVRPPTVRYPQLWGDFVPNLSIVDALFNCGPKTAERLFDLPAEGGTSHA